MNQDGLSSPLFLKYLSTFQKNPRSRVFAPLAEHYRKMGMLDKAMEIIKQGIRYNPDYVMGYLELAFCYADLKNFPLGYATLRPLVASNRDNLRLQKLFATICLELGQEEEALETYKYLLFMNPKDADVAKKVMELESKSNQGAVIVSPVVESGRSTSFEIDQLASTPFDVEKEADEWIQMDFTTPEVNNDVSAKDKIQEIHTEHIESDISDDEAPVITHTLVDLYCKQGHINKALNILEKILELNPHDQRTIEKLKTVRQMAQEREQLDETSGHQRLMELIDSKFGPKDRLLQLENKFNRFMSAIKKRAEAVK